MRLRCSRSDRLRITKREGQSLLTFAAVLRTRLRLHLKRTYVAEKTSHGASAYLLF
jgi:hypothetical protein